MKMHDECIPCLISQVIKTAHLTGAQDRETLYKQVFAYMATLDFNKTNPEVAGDTYAMLITKCKVIANDIGVPERSLVCLNHPNKEVTNL